MLPALRPRTRGVAINQSRRANGFSAFACARAGAPGGKVRIAVPVASCLAKRAGHEWLDWRCRFAKCSLKSGARSLARFRCTICGLALRFARNSPALRCHDLGSLWRWPTKKGHPCRRIGRPGRRRSPANCAPRAGVEHTQSKRWILRAMILSEQIYSVAVGNPRVPVSWFRPLVLSF